MHDAGNTTVASGQNTPPCTPPFLKAKLVEISLKNGNTYIPIMLVQNLTVNISKMIQPFYPIGQQEPEFSGGPHIINISMGRVMTSDSSLLNILTNSKEINRFDTSALGKSLDLAIKILEPTLEPTEDNAKEDNAKDGPTAKEIYTLEGCRIESYGTSISAGEFVLLENVSMLAKNITKLS